MVTLKEHNVRPYQEVSKMLEEKGICLYVSSTGTGKSYIASKLIEDNNYKALVICPKLAICLQWQKISEVDAITYQKLSKFTEKNISEIIEKYNIIIIDEAHHAGAEIWGKNILRLKELLEDYDIKILGLTADPIRYNDIEVDVKELIFSRNVVEGYDLSEAITNKILPTFTYVSVLYTYPAELLLRYREKFGTDKLIGRLDTMLNIEYITNIIHKHLPEGYKSRKIILFVSKIDEIESMKKLMEYVFRYQDISIFSIHSDKSINSNNSQISAFKSCRSKISVLISVNMLNEGVHISSVDTIIMLRKTSSPSVFFQQIGRALDVSDRKNQIVIYDLVGNRYNLSTGATRYKESTQNIFDTCEMIRKMSDQNIIYDYASDAIDVLKRMSELLDGAWTEEEDEILRKYYPTEGAKVYKRLPGRTAKACQQRAYLLGIKYITKNYQKWEDDILIENYEKNGPDYCKELLPHRSLSSIYSRGRKLGLKYDKPWEEWEDDILKEEYKKYGPDVYIKLPNRTRKACNNRALFLNLNCDINRPYNKKEDEILIENYKKLGAKKCAEMLDRSVRSVYSRAKKLGITVPKIKEV